MDNIGRNSNAGNQTFAPIPTPQPMPGVVDNAHSPTIYFEGSPTCQHRDGIIGVTLSVDLPAVDGSNEIAVTRTVVAYLRSSVPAAVALRDSLDKAILMAMPVANASS